MIPAAPSPLFRRVFAAHVRGRVTASFGALRVQGLEHLQDACASGPVLVVSNHASWWDPLVALLLTEALAADGRALMDARNLARLPFFRLVGAFGVDLSDPRDGAVALRHAARHLVGPGRLVWIFPQGRERAEDPRPLGFLPGAAAVARLAPRARVVPVALRYVFVGEERPEILVAVGPPLPSERDPERACRAQEEAVEALLESQRALLAEPSLRVQAPTLLAARPSRLGPVAEQLLSWLVGRWLAARPPAALPGRSAGPGPASSGGG